MRTARSSRAVQVEIAVNRGCRARARYLDRIFVPLVSSESGATRESDNKYPDCGEGKKGEKIEKKWRERERERREGRSLIRRSLEAISASRPLFLCRAILLCLNEVGDSPPAARPIFSPFHSTFSRSSYIAGNFVLSVLRSFNSASNRPRRLQSPRRSIRFLSDADQDSARAGLLASLIFRNK